MEISKRKQYFLHQTEAGSDEITKGESEMNFSKKVSVVLVPRKSAPCSPYNVRLELNQHYLVKKNVESELVIVQDY